MCFTYNIGHCGSNYVYITNKIHHWVWGRNYIYLITLIEYLPESGTDCFNSPGVTNVWHDVKGQMLELCSSINYTCEVYRYLVYHSPTNIFSSIVARCPLVWLGRCLFWWNTGQVCSLISQFNLFNL